MTFLLDVNVLYILHQPLHADYELVHRWFSGSRSDLFATCAMTQAGMLRLLMQEISGLDRFPIDDARRALKKLTEHPRHVFWPDALPYLDIADFLSMRVQGHRQITDAYLLGLAVRNGGVLATLDAGIRHIASAEYSARVELIQ
jgi:toxin-antitoxin system PIN domain toxin